MKLTKKERVWLNSENKKASNNILDFIVNVLLLWTVLIIVSTLI